MQITILFGLHGMNDASKEAHNTPQSWPYWMHTESMPPVLPHQLVKVRGREFAVIILQQKDRLFERWNKAKNGA
jgi:hypothetical protein